MVNNIKLQELMKQADFDPSKERKELTIRKLCEDIEDGSVVLPIFQTYIRWTKEKAKELFNYQLAGKAPVAPISINRIDDPGQVIDQINFLSRKMLDKTDLLGKLSVADGQQRLSTNYKAYINDPDFQNIVLDLQKGSFITFDMNVQTQATTYQIPVGILYNKEQSLFLNYVNSRPSLKKDNIKDLLSSIRKKHQNYYYVVNFATNMSKAEQMGWFDVLNLAGTQITAAMVYLTDLLVKGVDFYTEYAIPFAEKLDDYGFGDLFPRKSTEISIPLAALNPAFYKVTAKTRTNNSSPIPSDVNPKLIGKADASDIKKMIKIALNALNDTLHFIDSTSSIIKPQRIDIITYLVGLFIENDILEINDKQKGFLVKWTNEVDFINNSNKLRRKKYNDLLIKYTALATE
ncbi:DUF262 domain-containing protein [Clostridium estertheticum]|uniref:GmrSD restriction endonuclease domain-containing protein n=1 Tax=Clostridium estertheticum TaxID=238834 RepID=UPI001CF1053D|nr:DUF262 domain-containing protein [Clostridium estertheticum]MCB2356918.1 DUF262 domain-containing protein [Clostridium estertheticum]WAG44004.1 DUF262 domain-containing protein [Clostridium estertheticum]